MKYPEGVSEVNGVLHFDIPKILRAWNFEDTPEERARVTKIFSAQLKQMLPNAQIHVVEQNGRKF